MKVLIHACPQRMWYVEEFLAPNLRSQGAEVEIWNDVQGIIFMSPMPLFLKPERIN